MKKEFAELSVNGKFRKFPAMSIDDLTIVVMGKWLKTAVIKGEFWLEGDVVGNPEHIVTRLKHENLGADLFTFSQKPPSIEPKYSYHLEWTNVAAIPITSFSSWWEDLPQVTRKNVRRAKRRGTVVNRVDFDDKLIEGIVNLNNSTPYRQGRYSYHYGKSFEEVKKDYSEYVDRSEYLGAYYLNELIGIIRLIYMGEITGILQLLCMPQHADRRPANALIAKAVELCAERKNKYLIYGQHVYGQNIKATLTEFKKRNGFECIRVPSYYIPMTAKGRIATMCKLHTGIKNILPKPVVRIVLGVRGHALGRRRNRFFEENSE